MAKILFVVEEQRKAARGNREGLVCAPMMRYSVFRNSGIGFCSRAGEISCGRAFKTRNVRY